MKRLLTSVALTGLLAGLSPVSAADFRVAHDGGYAGAESLDPISPTRFFYANQMLYSRLVRQDDQGVPSPDLATKWSASADAKTWIFDLRPNVKFHDGSDFTAEDVKYTLERIKDPKIDSPAAAVLNVIKSVDVIDNHKIKINLSSAHADLPLLLMDYRIRMIDKDSGPTIEKTGNGTGPFILEELDPTGTTVLKANPNYWEGQPAAEHMHIIAIPDSNARIQALLAGQIDMEDSVVSAQSRLFQKNAQFKSQNIATGEWRALIFRTDTKPFDNPKVRKALRLLVDRQAMMKLVSGDNAGVVTCDHPVWSGDQYRNDGISCDADIAQAKKLLAEAGYKDGIEIDISSADNEPEWIRMIEVYQQQAAKAGIKVNLNMVPSDGYWSDVWMKHPAVATRWSQRPADQILNEAFTKGASWNESYFDLPEYDSTLKAARSELDFAKRKELYGKAQNILWEQGGSLIPYHLNQTRVIRTNVEGVDPLENFSLRWHKIVAK